MEEQEIKETTELISHIYFEVKRPISTDESIFNSIILGLSDYQNVKNIDFDEKNKQKELNNILMRIQRQIDDLIILED